MQKWDAQADQEQSQGSADERSWSYSRSSARSSGSSGTVGDDLWAALMAWLKRIFRA